MNIREMVLGDLKRVAELAEQLGYKVEASELRERFQVLSSATGASGSMAIMPGVFFVAEENGGVVGWIYIAKVMTFISAPRAQIWALVVDKAMRGRGVGRALVTRAEEWARDVLGISVVNVGSNEKRLESHPFYLGIGYHEKKRWVLYEKQI